MRRALAVTLAAGALGIALLIPLHGAMCGAKRVSASCFSEAECDAKAECLPMVHPFSWPFVALTVIGLAGAIVRRRDVVLGGAVLVAALSSLLGLSIGSITIYAAAALVASGFALPARDGRERWLAWAALAVVLAAVPVFVFVVSYEPRSAALLFLSFFAPALAWFALAAALTLGRRRKEERGGRAGPPTMRG